MNALACVVRFRPNHWGHPLAIALATVTLTICGCGNGQANSEAAKDSKETKKPAITPENKTPSTANNSKMKQATFGAGCFWCVEAVFQQLNGVESVESGYTGGHLDNPTYDDVKYGMTGHAEVCRVEYDPSKITFAELLEVFWKTHDPTTLNRQGADRGTQYRSAVFYHDTEQRELAEKYKSKLDKSGAFDAPIVTEISPLAKYYKAEQEHQDFYRLNPQNHYCQVVIPAKLEKLKAAFADKLKAPDSK